MKEELLELHCLARKDVNWVISHTPPAPLPHQLFLFSHDFYVHKSLTNPSSLVDCYISCCVFKADLIDVFFCLFSFLF